MFRRFAASSAYVPLAQPNAVSCQAFWRGEEIRQAMRICGNARIGSVLVSSTRHSSSAPQSGRGRSTRSETSTQKAPSNLPIGTVAPLELLRSAVSPLTLHAPPKPPDTAHSRKQKSDDQEDYWFCVMNEKYLHAESTEAHLLSAVGLGPDASKKVAVVDSDKCNDVFTRLANARAHLLHRRSLPKGVAPLSPGELKLCRDIMSGWPRWLRNAVPKVFARIIRAGREKHDTVESMQSSANGDYASALQSLFDQRYEKIRLHEEARDIQNTAGLDAPAAGTTSPQGIETPLVAAVNAVKSSKATSAREIGPSLNEEQARAIRLIETGYNMYIGGNAGTGKTVLIRAAQRKLEAMGLRVAVTATTGIAGTHIGGSTFHHALGVNLNGEFIRKQSVMAYDVVIIDEVSMMSLKLFEEFDAVARVETGCHDLPFGGIQVILVGDFMQLSAINETSIFKSKLFFENFVRCKLTIQVRQAENAFFAEQLAIMRRGAVPMQLISQVKTLPKGTLEPNAINLLPTNAEVREANDNELQRLSGESVAFNTLPQPPTIVKRTSVTLALQTVGTLVFDKNAFEGALIAHLDSTVGWPHSAYVSIYKQNDDAYACRLIYPEGAADEWVVSCNKAFLDFIPKVSNITAAVRVFEIYEDCRGRHPAGLDETFDGMLEKLPLGSQLRVKVGAKVLLRSNLTTGLVNGTLGTVVGFAPCAISSVPEYLRDDRMADAIAKYYNFCLYEGVQEPVLPVVRFYSGEEIAVPPIDISVGGYLATHHYSASIIAIPLTLAYAFTVHKVQGLTLVGRVHLELSKMWPCNHLLYVAFSRVKNLEQLSMSAFSPEMIIVDEAAAALDASLSSVHEPHMPPEATVAFWKAIQMQSKFGKSFEQILDSSKKSVSIAAAKRSEPSAQPSTEPTETEGTSRKQRKKLSPQERRLRKVVKNVSKNYKVQVA